MNVSFLSLAQTELDDAFAWYEEQAIGLGYEFLDEFDQTVRLIVSFPDSFQKIEMELRRCYMNRFPYVVIYGHEKDRIIIVAVSHARRKPKHWIDRI